MQSSELPVTAFHCLWVLWCYAWSPCCSWETTHIKGVRERKQGGFILSYFKAVSIYLPFTFGTLQEGSLLCPGGWAEGNEILIQSRFCCLTEPVRSVLPATVCREVLFPSQTYTKLNKQILPVMSFLIILLPKKRRWQHNRISVLSGWLLHKATATGGERLCCFV